MFRICKIASLVTKNVRPIVILQTQNQSGRQRFTIAQRFYSKQKDGKTCRKTEPNRDIDKSKGVECMPKEKKSCKPPEIPPCRKKEASIPTLQICTKPNLMSELPKPDCAWEAAAARARRRNRTILILGLLLATLTLAALLYSLRDKTKKGPKVKVVKRKRKETRKILKNVPVKIPSDASEIPKEVPYLLIGGGTASFSAFRAIKSADPLAKVLVVSSDGYYPYMRPPLSKELWFNDDPESVKKLEFKQWNGSQRSLFYEPDDFYIACKDLLASENGGVSVARGWTISHIDVIERIAYLEEGHAIKYDKCLIATGATPRNLLVFENADPKVTDNVTLFRNVYDFEAVNSSMDQVKSIAVIGGSFLGSELACALGRKVKEDPGFKVYQIFKEGGNMGKILPEYLSYWTTDKVKTEGVEVLANSEVTAAEAVTGENDVDRVKLTLNNGRHVTVDRVIVTIGVEPNTTLAEKSDLEVDPELGGFLANTELQTRSDLYVAGDCVCFYDVKLGRRRVEHHDHAVITGRLAGENMTGGRKPYLHQSMFWSDLGPDVGYEAIGIVDSTLPTVGVFAKATDKDNPKAVVTTTDEGLRSSSENEIPEECKKYVDKQALTESNKLAQEKRREASNAREGEDFGKGVIFYLRDDIVVGIVLWNVFNRMQIARQVLSDERKYEDLNEVAKLFNIHEE